MTNIIIIKKYRDYSDKFYVTIDITNPTGYPKQNNAVTIWCVSYELERDKIYLYGYTKAGSDKNLLAIIDDIVNVKASPDCEFIAEAE